MRTRLIVRSTRGLALTAAGERFLPRFMRVVAEVEELFIGCTTDPEGIEGHVQIQGPTTVTSMFLGALFSEFQAGNPRVSLDIHLVDRSVNPLDGGVDMVFGAQPTSYPNVVDVPLCHYPLLCCCSPEYLRARQKPLHPQELVDHECLTSVLLGNTWQFENPPSTFSRDCMPTMRVSSWRGCDAGSVSRSSRVTSLTRICVRVA